VQFRVWYEAELSSIRSYRIKLIWASRNVIRTVILTPNSVGVVGLYVQVELISNNGHEDELEYDLSASASLK
jgi:hypothetical protein